MASSRGRGRHSMMKPAGSLAVSATTAIRRTMFGCASSCSDFSSRRSMPCMFSCNLFTAVCLPWYSILNTLPDAPALPQAWVRGGREAKGTQGR